MTLSTFTHILLPPTFTTVSMHLSVMSEYKNTGLSSQAPFDLSSGPGVLQI